MSRLTSGINARLRPNTQLLMLALVLWPIAPILSQAVPNNFYKIKVVLNDGQRLHGLVGEMTELTLVVREGDESGPPSGGTVAFTDIKRVIIKQASKKTSRIKGAIIGGLITGFAVVTSNQKNQFRSSAITAVNATLTVGVGVLAGTLVGHLVGNTKRIVVRPTGTDPETIARSIKLQLEPFSYDYQQKLIHDITN